jgi:hypothetical protein
MNANEGDGEPKTTFQTLSQSGRSNISSLGIKKSGSRLFDYVDSLGSWPKAHVTLPLLINNFRSGKIIFNPDTSGVVV